MGLLKNPPVCSTKPIPHTYITYWFVFKSVLNESVPPPFVHDGFAFYSKKRRKMTRYSEKEGRWKN